MYGLMGERLLKQFLGNIRRRKNGDATNEAELPANDSRTADRLDDPGPEEAEEKQEVESQHENGRRAR